MYSSIWVHPLPEKPEALARVNEINMELKNSHILTDITLEDLTQPNFLENHLGKYSDKARKLVSERESLESLDTYQVKLMIIKKQIQVEI